MRSSSVEVPGCLWPREEGWGTGLSCNCLKCFNIGAPLVYTVLSIGFNGVLSRKIFSFNQGIFGENNDTFSDEKCIFVSVQRYSLLFR